VAPLRRADDAHYVDSTGISAEDVVTMIERLVCGHDD
jgi:cytidylate kinase